MSGSHRGIPRGSLRLLSLLAATGLALATAPAHASPLTPPAPRDAQAAAAQVGPEIVDSSGRVIWFSPVTNGQVAADFRVQSYRGKPVLSAVEVEDVVAYLKTLK